MLCFIAFNVSEYLLSHGAGEVWQREDHITSTTNILRIYVLVFSLHIFGMTCYLFQNEIKVYYTFSIPE